MSKKIKKLLITLFATIGITSLAACGIIPNNTANNSTPNIDSSIESSQNTPTDTENNIQNVVSSANKTPSLTPTGEYKNGVVLVKYDKAWDNNVLCELDYKSVTPLYEGSKWYSVTLNNVSKTEEAVQYLYNLGNFEAVDYDYVMNTDAEVESVDVSCNPDYEKQKHHPVHKIPEGWEEVKKNGKHPGGSEDVVIAVIDTGVDYNHVDLRNNIWTNSAEIAGNGIDDDKNGYIDDINGWDCVGNDNNPIDDNGHGTHVAGIIAAENNKIGGVGVAYGCKVMVLKAGNSSGYFNNSDIAEAVQYAYMNGASVINMSFGGSSISLAVEEALENAYNSCVLVAAAGNDTLCNNLSCKTCDNKGVSYPAALPYVIGVMSTTCEGTAVSGFSNYDHNPYDSVEYEVYAVGESIPSCWPNNKYATLNGTSMAAPTVSGIAALLRSAYPDREMYSTKYLQSQIVNTGTINPYNYILETTDNAHSVTNVYEALTRIPTPEVNLYDYSIDDSVEISVNNNGNGVMDAGETVRLYISLHNRGGVASDVSVTIDTLRNGEFTDPYFTIVNDTMQLSDIGTYSVRESGDNYFEIIVDSDCPNDYLVNFNIRFTYTNGLDTDDKTVYEDDGRQQAQFNVSSGYHLPSIIGEDTVFTNDRLYIVGEDVLIPASVTVTFEEGCRIQFYDDSEYYNSPRFEVYGTLNIIGTKEDMITIDPSERYSNFGCEIENKGVVSINYVDARNLYVTNNGEAVIDNSILRAYESVKGYLNGQMQERSPAINVDKITNSYVELITYGMSITVGEMSNNYIRIASNNMLNGIRKLSCANFTNNILFSERVKGSAGVSSAYFTGTANNNWFVGKNDDSVFSLIQLGFSSKDISSNTFSVGYQQYASQVIKDYYDANGNPTVDVYGQCSDISLLYPHVAKVQLFNKDGEEVTTIGKEEITVRVTFNRAMDTTQNTFATFGTIEPYADYRIDGEYISDTVWEGKYTLKAQIENGLNYLKINNACQADDITKQVLGQYQLYEFNIDTTAAMSMNLQAVAKENGIELTFAQDDYDTLLGYNIYRSTEKDGNYVKLNPAILMPTENTFFDDNAEPGKTYWYTYTVVLSDFTESNPAGKVMATTIDTLYPSIYHTPVNQGYQNNNLVISCTASDNVAISSVTLYYRTYGETTWKTLVMSKTNDKYSATVFGSDLTLDGLEYYIVASDGRNTIEKASAETPYFVVIKDASSISTLGDVDGDAVVTTKDALMLMQCINGDLLLSDDEFKRADLNKDGVLSSVEALRILQYINGNVTSLEM